MLGFILFHFCNDCTRPLITGRELVRASDTGVDGSEHDAGHDGQNGQDRQPAHDQHGTDGSSGVRRVHVPIP